MIKILLHPLLKVVLVGHITTIIYATLTVIMQTMEQTTVTVVTVEIMAVKTATLIRW
jgi:hypothetical protein